MDLENQYYNSKALKEDDPKAALSSFQKVEWYSIKIISLLHLSVYVSFKKAQYLLTSLLLCVQVLELEGEKGEWGFKALKQMIKINFKLVCTVTYAITHLHFSQQT